MEFIRKFFPVLFLLSILGSAVFAQETEYSTENNIQYYDDSGDKADEYRTSRCVLDIYYPNAIDNFATIVWFHGGGLTAGNKAIPEELKEKGVAVAAVNYRFISQGKVPCLYRGWSCRGSLGF